LLVYLHTIPNAKQKTCEYQYLKSFGLTSGVSGATRSLLTDGGVEELHGDPTAGPCTKVWTRGQKWMK